MTEPAIIATESPNPIVSQADIFPNIEKIESFMYTVHGIIVFPVVLLQLQKFYIFLTFC